MITIGLGSPLEGPNTDGTSASVAGAIHTLRVFRRDDETLPLCLPQIKLVRRSSQGLLILLFGAVTSVAI